MPEKTFVRRSKETKPVLAICYDFDKTLSPDDMQAQGYIQSVGFDTEQFWKESNNLAETKEMDQNLAYMYKMMREAEGQLLFTKKTLSDYGAKVSLFPGVEDWFKRIRDYGKDHGITVEHYIISSGLKEMIEGTKMAKEGEFEKIYASSFYYNDRGTAEWPAQVVNYTNKTQFLFRIQKGVLDVNDPAINDYFRPDEIRIPFRNMVYIGDSDTDIPCMKLVNSYGGHSIGVYNAETNDKRKVHKMIRENRIKYFAPADYTENSHLDNLVKSIIDRTEANEKLESIHFKDVKDTLEGSNPSNDEMANQKKEALVAAFESSNSFASTHTLIKELRNYPIWTVEEKEALYRAAIANQQIRWILKDKDLIKFYKKLLVNANHLSKAANEVKSIIEDKD